MNVIEKAGWVFFGSGFQEAYLHFAHSSVDPNRACTWMVMGICIVILCAIKTAVPSGAAADEDDL